MGDYAPSHARDTLMPLNVVADRRWVRPTITFDEVLLLPAGTMVEQAGTSDGRSSFGIVSRMRWHDDANSRWHDECVLVVLSPNPHVYRKGESGSWMSDWYPLRDDVEVSVSARDPRDLRQDAGREASLSRLSAITASLEAAKRSPAGAVSVAFTPERAAGLGLTPEEIESGLRGTVIRRNETVPA